MSLMGMYIVTSPPIEHCIFGSIMITILILGSQVISCSSMWHVNQYMSSKTSGNRTMNPVS